MAGVLVGAVVILLFVGFEVGAQVVAPDAVRVSVAAAADGHLLATRTITDARTVADLYARINRLPSAGPYPVYHCGLSGPDAVTFSLRFLRWGLPIEVAMLPVCGGWEVSRGGIYDVRNDPDGQTRVILDEIQPLTCPQAWQPSCDGC